MPALASKLAPGKLEVPGLGAELARGEWKGVATQQTRDPRRACQFATKKSAVQACRALGWPVSAPSREAVMGFLVWCLADDHGNFLTARGVLRLFNDRAAAFEHAALTGRGQTARDTRLLAAAGDLAEADSEALALLDELRAAVVNQIQMATGVAGSTRESLILVGLGDLQPVIDKLSAALKKAGVLAEEWLP